MPNFSKKISKLNISAVIQARMGSTRLPGKVLKKIDGKPILQYQIERIKKSKLINQIIIATTKEKKDKKIENLAKKMNIKCFRGSTNDVLGRVAGAIKKFKVDIHVELISDSPFSDPKIIDKIIYFFLRKRKIYHYVSNGMKLTYPSGMEVSVCDAKKFLQVNNKVRKNDRMREHVEVNFTKNMNIKKCNLIAPKKFYNPNIFLEIDTPKDFIMISKIIKHFNKTKKFSYLGDILSFLKKKPNIININNRIKRTWTVFKLKNTKSMDNIIL